MPLPTKFKFVAIRATDLGEFDLKVANDAAQIAVCDCARNIDDSLLIDAVNLHRPFLALHLNDLFGVNQLATRSP